MSSPAVDRHQYTETETLNQHDKSNHHVSSTSSLPSLPQRTVLHSPYHVLNARVWDSFEPKPGDIVINTYAKAGTTWLSQIVYQLKCRGCDEQAKLVDFAVWVEHGIVPTEVKLKQLQQQSTPRLLRSHMPLNAIRYDSNTKYVYICRHIGDVALSLYNHYCSFTQGGRERIKWGQLMSFDEFYDVWIHSKEGVENQLFWPFCEHVSSWWQYRHLPNILFLHYEDLKLDHRGQVKRIAEFLQLPVTEQELDAVVEHSTFDYMKRNEHLFEPTTEIMQSGKFIHKGISGRWKQVLNEQQKSQFEKLCREKWSDECRQWVNRE